MQSSSVTIDLLRDYLGRRVIQLIVGQVVQYDGMYWIVESTGLATPLELTPIIKNNSRAVLIVED